MAVTCVDDGNGMVLCRKAGETVDWDDGAVRAYLVGQGIAVGPGGVGCGTDATGPFVRVHLPGGGDPSAALDAYAPAANPVRTARRYLRQRVAAIKATDPSLRTTGDRDLLALLTVMREDG